MIKAFAGDFGAGNTCLYWINPDAAVPVATPLNDPLGEPSGYAVQHNNINVLGRGLYGLRYENLKNIREFHINIKKIPTEQNRAELTNYFKLWHEKLQAECDETNLNDGDEEFWFMGFPTGEEWKSKEVRKLYKQIFEDAGFKNVYLVPESNGAVAYFQKTDNILDKVAAGIKLFLIDLGAYSIDTTPYFGEKIGTSYGKYLGASLIERMMLRAILYFPETDFRKGKRIINLPETINVVRQHYEDPETHEEFANYMLLQARKLKEDYFTKEKSNILPNGNLTWASGFTVGESDDAEEFILFINSDMMKKLLKEMPVRQILDKEFEILPPEVQEYIGNLTWMGTLRKFLGDLSEKYGNLGTGENSIIMLTGGGSLMKCFYDEVKTFFPNARIYSDPEAISAIGEGIAYWACKFLKSKS